MMLDIRLRKLHLNISPVGPLCVGH